MSSIWMQEIRHGDDVLHQELGGEVVLLNLKTEHYFGLDAVGARIWQIIGDTHSAEAVVTQLLQEYDVGEAQLRGDVERLLGELATAGLVTIRDQQPA